MIRRFYKRANALNSVTIRSAKFPDVYLRCDGSKVDKFTGPGSGVVNCQYKPDEEWELFHIYPIAMKPSLAPPSEFPVHILSAEWDNVYIRMDGSGMDKPNASGGGCVNCQYGARSYEQFYYRSEGNGGLDGKFSFRSIYFPHCYLRLDGTNVVAHTGPGGGTVNCQYYDNPSSALPNGVMETFYIS
ncbi:Extracellular metalloprotease [Oopsacas minuta]|uniref:Extracellular metalloprotease n=1 Tax=Oopsacas minuta TaxID=111878 RepID=A0AAV7JHY3_9METZ|nr:Extracellular metalloprotease [Oopsacas minuta]